MDKRSLRIIIGSLFCFAVVVLLFIIAFRFAINLTCELTHLDPTRSHELALKDFRKLRPIRSNDKVMLMKISAFFEYAPPSDGGPSQWAEWHGRQQPPGRGAPAAGAAGVPSDYSRPMFTAPAAAGGISTPLNSLIGRPYSPAPATADAIAAASINSNSNNNNHLFAGPLSQPSTPQNGLPPPAGAPAAGTGNLGPTSATWNMHLQNATGEPLGGNKPDPRRFMPLELDSIEAHKYGEPEDRTHEYVLNFNCSIMKMRVVRRTERVQIVHIGMELQVPSKHRTRCEVQLVNQPNQQPLFLGVESPVNGMGHYHCEQQRRMSCFYADWNDPQQQRVHLGDLYINALEFEVGAIVSANEKRTHKKYDFIGLRVTSC